MEKICSKCKLSKQTEEFHKNSMGEFGVHSVCKKCYNEHKEKYSKINKINVSKSDSLYYVKNKQKIDKKNKEYRLNNPEKMKEIESRPQRKIANSIRARTREAILKGYRKSSSTELTGCSIEDLKKYIEGKFKSGMTWKNHGFGDDKWHIDHIIPCDAFDLTKLEEQHKCFHYTNLQPLWQHENLSKGSKVI